MEDYLSHTSRKQKLRPTVDDPSDPDACIRLCLSIEPKLSSSSEVLEAIKGLNVGKASSQYGIKTGVIRHLSTCAKTFLDVFRRQYFPPALKHARVVSVLNLGKDPMLTSSYTTITQLTRVLRDNERGILHTSSLGSTHT